MVHQRFHESCNVRAVEQFTAGASSFTNIFDEQNTEHSRRNENKCMPDARSGARAHSVSSTKALTCSRRVPSTSWLPPARTWCSPPRRSARRPRAQSTCWTSPLRPWDNPSSYTACLRTTVCTPGAASDGWGRCGGGKPPRERTSPLHRNWVEVWGALQECRASILLHMCVACRVPRLLTTAVRNARARGPRRCLFAAVGDRAPFPTAVGNALS